MKRVKQHKAKRRQPRQGYLLTAKVHCRSCGRLLSLQLLSGVEATIACDCGFIMQVKKEYRKRAQVKKP